MDTCCLVRSPRSSKSDSVRQGMAWVDRGEANAYQSDASVEYQLLSRPECSRCCGVPLGMGLTSVYKLQGKNFVEQTSLAVDGRHPGMLLQAAKYRAT
jgi:hypothetical protein